MAGRKPPEPPAVKPGTGEQMPQEMTVEETRASIAGEVFGESAGAPPETKTEPIVEAKVEEPTAGAVEPDPWEGVSPVIRKEFDALREKVGGVEKIEGRLKQAERRVGSLTDELRAAKQVAKTTTDAPSAAQMEAAATSQADWDALKVDYPEWAKGVDSRFAAERAEILKQMPDVAAIRDEFQKKADEGIAGARTEFNQHLVRLKHPDWVKKTESPEFIAWHKERGEPNSFDPFEVIQILDEFDAHTKKKPTKQIVAEREQRLEQSQKIEGRKLPAAKSEADMSPEELRASVAKEVWR
jgi:hypothetical protein